jgi:peptidyl-prolyl cis-trans isomerase D
MMRTMRASAKWIMGVVAFLFVGWMIYGYGMDITGRGSARQNVIARVNGRPIDAQTFYQAVRNEQERMRQQQQAAPSTLEGQRQLENDVLEQLVQNMVLRDELNRRGITVTDQEIRDAAQTSPPPEVLELPEFQTEGRFDMQKYQRFISSSADPNFLLALEARYRDELPRVKLMEQLTAGIFVSDAELWQEYRDRHDSVTVAALALVPQPGVTDSATQVSEAEIEAYYRDHRKDFERPATAYLSFIAVSRRANAADSAAALARAKAVRQEIASGADFADVAKRESADSTSRVKGGDLGDVPRGSFIPAFEQAALALRPGQLSEPVLTQYGYHIIKLQSRTDSTIHAWHILIPIEPYGEHLAEVEAQADTLDLFAAEQDDPTALDNVGRRLGVPVAQAPKLLEGDRLQLGRFLIGDAGIWAFGGAQPGQTSPVIETDWAYYVFRLDSLTPAGVAPLAEVKADVTQLAQAVRLKQELARTAAEVADRIKAGASLEDVAARRGLTVRTFGPFTRYTPPAALQGAPEVIGAAFRLRVGETGGPYPTDYATYFLRSLKKKLADSAVFAGGIDTLRASAQRQASQARLQLVFASLRQSADVKDLRKELEQAQRAAQAAAPTPSPRGR